MTKRLSIACTGAMLFGTMTVTGCVPQDKYDSLLQANRSMVEQITSVNEERQTLFAQIKNRDAQLSQARSEIRRLQGEYATVGGEIETLIISNDDLAQRLAEMQPTALPADIERQMITLAEQHADMLNFDPDSGLIRLSSDLTFGSGSHQLKSDADAVIGDMAGILDDGDLNNYQVLVIGHTDDVPLARSKPKYGSNLMLSAYRANSVRNAMVDAGMEANRIRIAGDGPYNPIAPATEGGTAANRRVEIFLVARPASAPEATTATVDDASVDKPINK